MATLTGLIPVTVGTVEAYHGGGGGGWGGGIPLGGGGGGGGAGNAERRAIYHYKAQQPKGATKYTSNQKQARRP